MRHLKTCGLGSRGQSVEGFRTKSKPEVAHTSMAKSETRNVSRNEEDPKILTLSGVSRLKSVNWGMLLTL